MIRALCHDCQSTHIAWSIAGDFAITTVHPASLDATQYWWRAHQTRIAAKVLQLECLVVLFSPAAVFIGVFSVGRVLLQVVDPSFTGASPCGVSSPSAHVACEAFSLAFCLSATPAFALAFLLGFLNGPSCFLRVRLGLAVARHIQWVH